MSYYTQHFTQQQNPQQKTLRLFLVIAFHALLIWAIVASVGKNIGDVSFLLPIQIKVVEPPKPIPIDPIDVNVTDKTLTTKQVIKDIPFEIDNSKGDDKVVVTKTDVTTGTYTSGLIAAKIKLAPKPEYPSAASRLLEQGTTGMRLLITAEGRVANAEVIQSSGSSRLDQAAVKHAMRTWLFTPCTENGKAVSCEQNMRLKWQLEDAKR